MSGLYRLLVGGEEVSRGNNLITNQGRTAIIRYLSGQDPSWAGSISIGSNDATAAVTDENLSFEFARAEIEWKEADEVNFKVVTRATFPADVVGEIHEVGLWSTASGGDTEAPGIILTDFDPNATTINNGSEEITDVRVGESSMRSSIAASASETIEFPYFAQDFSMYEQTDQFSLAYFLYDANASNIEIRLKKDAANYQSYSFAPGVTVGYNVHSWEKSDFVATGSLNWDEITSMDIIFTAGAGGSSDIVLDAFRVDDTDDYEGVYFVSRAIISPAFVASINSELQIEYSLPFSI